MLLRSVFNINGQCSFAVGLAIDWFRVVSPDCSDVFGRFILNVFGRLRANAGFDPRRQLLSLVSDVLTSCDARIAPDIFDVSDFDNVWYMSTTIFPCIHFSSLIHQFAWIFLRLLLLWSVLRRGVLCNFGLCFSSLFVALRGQTAIPTNLSLESVCCYVRYLG